jgi:hypothetical protein
VAPHGTGRAARRVYEERVDACRAYRRRLKIGGNATNFHSCAPGRFSEPAHTLVACVTGENPGSAGFERDGFASGRGAGVVDLLAWRDRGKARNEGMRGVLNDESAFGEAR